MALENKKIKILGITATPIKEGNVWWQMNRAAEICKAYGPNIEVEILNIYDYNVKRCVGCDFCVKQTFRAHAKHGWDIRPLPIIEYNCSIKDDDMPMFHKKMVESDALMVGAPVYIVSVPGPLKDFIDRCRTFIHDYRLEGRMAIPMCVSFFRDKGGQSTNNYLTDVLSGMNYTLTYGSVAMSSKFGIGGKVEDTRHAISKDEMSMAELKQSVNHFMKNLLMLKAGQEALGEKVLKEDWLYNKG